MLRFFPSIFTLILCSFLSIVVNCDHHEYNLYKYLLKDYDILERPVANNSDSVTVTLLISLQQIVDVDEKNQIVYLNAWLNFGWWDYRLVWDPKQYGGVKDVRFKKGYLWKPDVLLYNSVDSSFDSSYPSNMIVYSDGSIIWIPPGIFQISCKINIKWFPFDEQNCFLKFGSWTYDGLKLNLQNSSETGFDMSEYLENGEWAIQSVKVERVEKFYECCPEPYPSLFFWLTIRRRTLYFGFNLIIPCLLIALMTILNFTLPPDAGEKLTLSTTILLSVCFFLSILAATLPQTSEAVPLLGAFFSSCMFVVSLAVLQAVICLNFHYRTPDTHEMSHFTRSILLYWLPWLLMMKRPGYTFTWKNLPNPFKSAKDEKESESLLRNIRSQEMAVDTETGTVPEMHRHYSMDLEHRLARQMRKMDSTEVSMLDMFQQAMCLMMQQIHTEIRFMTKRMRKEDEDWESENDWKFAAMVIDRLSLFLFSIMIITSSCGILFSAPYLVA